MRNLKLLFVMMLALFLQPSVMNAQSSNEQELKELKQLLAESKQQLESGKEKDMKGKVKDMTESSRQALRSKIAEIENRINELSQKAALEEQRKQESTQQEAQQVLTAIAQGEITSDLTKMGYTLTRTTEIDGMKCEHYEKGTEELRTFKKSNGDFFTCKEDLNGFNKAPDDKEKAIGSLRLTSEDGIVLERLNDTYSVVLKNGNRFLMEGIGIPYKEFKKPYSFYGTLKSFYEKKIKVVYLANNPNVAYPCTNGNITIGNRVYACDVEGNFTPYMMTATVEGSDEKVCFYASPTDSIVKVEKMGKYRTDPNYGYTFYYANGDKVIKNGDANYQSLGEGTVRHFKNGVLKVKNGKMQFTKNDGTIFVGFFNEQVRQGEFEMIADPRLMAYSELTPYMGDIQYADGTIDKVLQGKSGKQVEKENEANKAQALAELEKVEKVYNADIARLGQKYGAAKVNNLKNTGNIANGYPMTLIQDFVNVHNKFETSVWGSSDYRSTAMEVKYFEPNTREVLQYGQTVKRVKLFRLDGGTLAYYSFLVANGKVVSVNQQGSMLKHTKPEW